MKDVIWAFPYWIDHFPGLGALISKNNHRVLLGILYLGIWAIVARILYIPKVNGQPMLEGFTISTVLTIIYYYWHSLPYTLSFENPHKKLVISKQDTSETSYRVLYKSPWTGKKKLHFESIEKEKEYYKKGFVIDAEKYTKYKKEGKIEDIALDELAEHVGHLKGSDKVTYDTPFEEMVSVSFYLLIVLYSVAIIIAKANTKMFRLLFPWIILSTVFLLIQSALWIQNPNVEKSVLTFIIKRQLFILGLSFSLTGILIVLKLNNR